MLRLLDELPHGDRLRDLLQRFRVQEQLMQQALGDQQARLEDCHAEASRARLCAAHGAEALLRRCRELQAECDGLAIELVHVRLAIAGAAEELGDLERRGQRSVAADGERLLTPA